ncbi:MAG: hypothetical protein HRU38_25555 [Saccharospirillaceae bacterium]|nr:hypothetical protein [Pseudomonadales bacterium]NRB81981.1 hypothetical protein [Saccharospirillaceae bacterium]
MCYSEQINQKGDVLLEALISIVLMAIIVMGVAIMTTQAAKNLSDTKASILVVNQLKNTLASDTRINLCGSSLSVQMPDGSGSTIYGNCTGQINITVDAKYTSGPKIGQLAAHTIPSKIDAPIIFNMSVGGLDYKVGGASPVTIETNTDTDTNTNTDADAAAAAAG